MRTLYLRNVPDDLVATLERLAADEGVSVNNLAVRELRSAVAFRANDALLAAIPDLGIAMPDLVEVVREGRDGGRS